MDEGKLLGMKHGPGHGNGKGRSLTKTLGDLKSKKAIG